MRKHHSHHAPYPHHLNFEYGFTFIESIITILLTSVLFFFAQQTYHRFQLSLHEEILQQNITKYLKLAKTLASIENRAITLCGSIDGKNCLPAQNYIWDGWLLFYDENATFSPEAEKILYYYPPERLSHRGFYLQTTVNIGGGINFSAHRQYAYGMARTLPNGRIKLCRMKEENIFLSKPQSSHYAFIINVYGYFRISKEKGAC